MIIAAGQEQRAPQPWKTPLFLALGALALLWPAFINGAPLIFPDTPSYVRAVDAAMSKLAGEQTAWTRPGEVERLSGADSSEASTAPDAEESPPTLTDARRVPLKGRSPYYGAFAYLGWVTSAFWLLALLQAVVASAAIYLFLRQCELVPARFAAPLAAGTLLILAMVTPLPFFASFVMPDLFAGLLILALAALLLDGRDLSLGEKLFWFLLVTAAALFHSANLLLAVAVIVVSLLLRWLATVKLRRQGLVLAAVATGIGAVGEIGYSLAVKEMTGSAPVRPPFLMARMIDDGPGYAYLRDTCPENGLMVCRYLDRLPVHSDTFLWSENETEGVFSTLSPDEKRQLSAEQSRFAALVLTDRPLDQAVATLISIGRQAQMMGLSEFNYEAETRRNFLTRLPPGELHRTKRTLAWQNQMPIKPLETVVALVLLLSLVAAAWLAIRNRRQPPTALLLVAGVVLNLAICGAMSTPHDRYQARVLWLIPLAALALVPRRNAAAARPSDRATTGNFA